MARWNIQRALEVAALLRERWPARWASLSTRLALDDHELGRWSRTVETIATGFDPGTGQFDQFAGFHQLEEVDLSKYAGRSVPMDVILGRDKIRRSQVIKQADVVALLGLLPAEFPGGTGAKNFHYYEPRCSHGSSLSRAMHGLVAARLGLSDLALHYFRQTAAIDLGDAHASSDGGIHIAALGGIWLTTVFGFAGLSLRGDGVALDPRLPPDWNSLSFSLQWRGRYLKIRIGKAEPGVDATLEEGEPMTLLISGQPHELRGGQTLHASIGELDVSKTLRSNGQAVG
jgi:trehalose/maltose hydrolase-like predicted phosphorylase